VPNWHGTPDWEPGQLVTAADLNAQIRDNVGYLFARPIAAVTADENSDFTTTATDFVDIDAGFSVLLALEGSRARVHFHGVLFLQGSSAGTQRAFFDVAVDGVRQAGDDGICFVETVNNGVRHVSFTRLITGLTPGTHTFRPQWKCYASAGTPSVTMYAGAGTPQANVHPQFIVEEC